MLKHIYILMKRFRDRGISAVVDAVIILAIVILGIIIGLAIASQNPSEFKQDEYHRRYVEYLTYVTLRSTIQKAWYNTTLGKVILEDKSVSEIIAEDLYIREYKSSVVDLNSLYYGLEKPIENILRKLTSPRYRFLLYATYKNSIIMIGDKDLPQIKYSFTRYLNMHLSGEKFMVTIYIWEVK